MSELTHAKTYLYQPSDVREITSTITKVILEPKNTTMSYKAGQYVNLFGPNQEPRPFSIANCPNHDKHIEFHIRHTALNIYANELISIFKNNQPITIQGPFGHCTLDNHSDKPLILVAYGTGLAPIKAILEQLIELQKSVPIYLYWSVRDPESHYMHFEKEELSKLENITVRFILSEKPKNASLLPIAKLPELITEDLGDLKEYQVYGAGAPNMMLDAYRHFIKHGLSKDQMFSDTLF